MDESGWEGGENAAGFFGEEVEEIGPTKRGQPINLRIWRIPSENGLVP